MAASNGGEDLRHDKASLSAMEETPEEKQLRDALKHLKLLHIKAGQLRSALPKMLAGVQQLPSGYQECTLLKAEIGPHVIPDSFIVVDSITAREAVFQILTDRVKTTGAEIHDFTKLYTSEESKQVFEQARKSYEANPKGIKPWLHQDHPNWWKPEAEPW